MHLWVSHGYKCRRLLVNTLRVFKVVCLWSGCVFIFHTAVMLRGHRFLLFLKTFEYNCDHLGISFSGSRGLNSGFLSSIQVSFMLLTLFFSVHVSQWEAKTRQPLLTLPFSGTSDYTFFPIDPL